MVAAKPANIRFAEDSAILRQRQAGDNGLERADRESFMGRLHKKLSALIHCSRVIVLVGINPAG
jgi:hypothetical protein